MVRLSVDIGGTFTDIVMQMGDRHVTHKLLTSSANPELAAIEGISTLLKRCRVKLEDVHSIIHGTTLATNALIERRGARTALVTTEGFRDVLEMRNEKRFDQYSLDIELPMPLVPRELRFTLPERILVDGRVLQTPSAENIANLAAILRQHQVEAVAIGFLHSYRYPQHEQIVAAKLREQLDDRVSICQSAEVANEIREYDRFSTVCANAYVRPLMASYLNRFNDTLVSQGFGGAFLMMLSGGGLTTLEQAAKTPVRLVESGPAGGALLAAFVSRQIHSERTLALDIGGTTAKICFIENGIPQTTRRFEVARAWNNVKGSGLPVRVPTIELVEIGAGGGSVVSVDAMQRLAVGPQSAGAQPGPSAYAQGGTQATVTDAHIVVGNISASGFAGGVITLHPELAESALYEQLATPLGIGSAQAAAAGVIEMADELMANAARVHGIELGKHIEKFDLLVSGGGGALHATRIAEKLGIRRVVIPENAGVGSAVGFLHTPVAFDVVISIMQSIDAIDSSVLQQQLRLATSNVTAVVRSVEADTELVCSIVAELRYAGQDLEFRFDINAADPLDESLLSIKDQFIACYHRTHGFVMNGIAVELVSLCVTARAESAKPAQTFAPDDGFAIDAVSDVAIDVSDEFASDSASYNASDIASDVTRRIAKDLAKDIANDVTRRIAKDIAKDIANDVVDDIAYKPSDKYKEAYRSLYGLDGNTSISYRVYSRDAIHIEDWLQGPAIVAEDQTTTIIRQGWRGYKRADGHLVLERGAMK